MIYSCPAGFFPVKDPIHHEFRPGRISYLSFGQNQSVTRVPSPGRKDDSTRMGTECFIPSSTHRS